MVVANTTTHILKDGAVDRLVDEMVALQKRENTNAPFLLKQLSELDKKIENILKAVEDGISNASVKTDDLENTRTDIEIAMAREKIEKRQPRMSKSYSGLAGPKVAMWMMTRPTAKP